jgi:hypothetical protein
LFDEGPRRDATIPVPVLPELELPREATDETRQTWIQLDAAFLPDRARDGLFAWRLSEHGTRRVRDILHPGDVAVLAPRPLKLPRLRSTDVWFVREPRPTLSRVLEKQGQLLLLAPPGREDEVELVPSSPRTAPWEALVAKVVVAIRVWGG